jgi:intein/homing endonuclease
VIIDNPNEWLEQHTKSVPENELWTAVDSETGGFDKLSDPIGDVTISFDGWTAYYLSWEKINPWIFHDFLKAHKLILANGKFDFLFFMFHGVDKDIQIAWDTMIAGHFLNEMRSNSLKTHAFLYTNYGGYDLELEKYKWKYPGLQSYLQISDSIRIPYACMDAAIDYQVWQAQVRDMKKEPNLWDYYHKYVLPMLRVTTKMEYNGFDIDWDKVTEVGGYIQENIKKALAEVRKVFKKPDLNPNKKQELGKYIESLGWPCINRNKSGGYKVSKKEFAEWEKQGHNEVKTLNEYSKWVIVWNTFIGANSTYDEDDAEYDEEGFEIEPDDENFEENFFTSKSEKVIHHDATGLWQYRIIDNKVHTTFHAFMTKSHRHRCVAKGTRIMVNRGYGGDITGVPVEDVKVGDYVFCYDNNCKPALKRVTWAGKTGHEEVVRLHFIGSHNHRGYLDVTPDHKIRLSDGSYCEAQYLLNDRPHKKYCKKASVLAMRRIGDRLFVTGCPDIREYRFVYEQLSGRRLSPKDTIHHKDGNHSNYIFSNLEVISRSEHSLHHVKDTLLPLETRKKNVKVVKRLHAQGHYPVFIGADNPLYKSISRIACIRMLVKARGRPSFVLMDFNTFKKKLIENGLKWEDIADRYSPDGKYIPKWGILRDLQTIGFSACHNKRNIGYYRLKRLCDAYGISYERAWANETTSKRQVVTLNNHAITSIEYRGDVVDVYDLTVEDAHNFIANEICVSNSSSPNLQNIPKRNYEVSQIVRQCYTVPSNVPSTPQEAEEIFVFDWKNGMTLHKMDELVEIGLTERIKVPAKDLGNYPQREYGYRVEYYRLTRNEIESDKENADFIEINDDILGLLKFKVNDEITVKNLSGEIKKILAKDILIGDTIINGGG